MAPGQKLIAVAAIGAILCYFSEMLFWSAPPEGSSAAGLGLTWGFYAFAGWGALVAASWSGPAGLFGLFLAGSLMGWIVEGVAVDEMYAALPFSLIWTPMAWHALVSGICGLWLVRASARWSVTAQLALLAGLGAAAGLWALYWPLERAALPGPGPVLAWLAGLGLAVPLANMALDRLPPAYPFSPREAQAAAGLIAALWALKLALLRIPALFAFPAVVVAALWLMRRLGGGPAPVLLPARPVHSARHLAFLLLPVTAGAVALSGWRRWPEGVETNAAFAIVLSAAAGTLTAAALWRGLRKPA